MLNRTLAAVAVLAFVAFPLTAQADPGGNGGTEMELTGQVIDVNCHVTGMAGLAHKQCARACAKAGVPLAILGRDGNVYIPVSSKPGDPQNSRLLEFAEARVTVKGIHRFAKGLHTIEIKSVAAARATYHYRGLPYSLVLDRRGQTLRATIAKEVRVP